MFNDNAIQMLHQQATQQLSSHAYEAEWHRRAAKKRRALLRNLRSTHQPANAAARRRASSTPA